MATSHEPLNPKTSNEQSMRARYRACMILAAVGDAMGYKNGTWEFCHSVRKIHSEVKALGGVENLKVSRKKGFMVSDDTVMHLATAESLTGKEGDVGFDYVKMAKAYRESFNDMTGRAPGGRCHASVHAFDFSKPRGYEVDFHCGAGGCGAAMRAQCIGLLYPSLDDESRLIGTSIESGRLTHNHPTGYLGALASALFTALAIRGMPIECWGAYLVSILPKAWDYIQESGRDLDKNAEHWSYFKNAWVDYLEKRGLTNSTPESPSKAVFPENYDADAREKFNASVSYFGQLGAGGCSGHDAPLIAYDCLLGSDNSWTEYCMRGVLHGGDSDSTGGIGAAWYGALNGFDGVPLNNFENVEYFSRLKSAADRIYGLATNNPNNGRCRPS